MCLGSRVAPTRTNPFGLLSKRRRSFRPNHQSANIDILFSSVLLKMSVHSFSVPVLSLLDVRLTPALSQSASRPDQPLAVPQPLLPVDIQLLIIDLATETSSDDFGNLQGCLARWALVSWAWAVRRSCQL